MSTEEETAAPQTSALKSFISGGCGGLALVAVGHPFDTIKVKLQAQAPGPDGKMPYAGMMDCARKTMAREGVGGLYRGIAPPAIGITPIFALCFWSLHQGKRIVRWAHGVPEEQELSLWQISEAGFLSAIPTTAIMTPGERIKCLLQVKGDQYSGMGDAAKAVWREGGLGSLYKGTVATIMRDGPGSMAYFGGYEGIKQMLTPRGASVDDLSPVAVFMAGGFAGIFNWIVAVPADTCKTRFQLDVEGKYRGARHVMTSLVREEGITALYRGIVPAMTRAFPANAACFMGVEVSLKVMNAMW